MFSVHDSVDCHGSSTTSSIHHEGSQHVQVQHRMFPFKLDNLKTCAWFMKNSSSTRMCSSSLTLFTSAAAEPFGCSDDESVRVLSSQRIDHSSTIRMGKFLVQARHHGSGCFSLFLTGQFKGSLFFLTESTMSIFLDDCLFC